MEAIAQKRSLTMDPKLLMDVIKRQAGTLGKANTEGVMNSIEARATYCEIHLDEKKMIIKDDGDGITSKEDLIAHFETFGTPHDKNEFTIWKQFRMGRGQMFSFGKNIWRTSQFEMTVDINNWGLNYELKEGLDEYKGCLITIELYENPISGYPYSSIDAYKKFITTQVRFVDIPIYFNGEQINTPVDQCNWDMEDDDAYYLFNVGIDLLFYNMGIYVMKTQSMGMGGFVVSKKQFKVNFARNEIMSDCLVYQNVSKVIKENVIKKIRKAKRHLTDSEKIFTLENLRDGKQTYEEVCNLSIIPTSQGKYITLNAVKKNRLPWTFSAEGDRFSDTQMELGQSLCIDEAIIDQLCYTGNPENFFTWLIHNEKGYSSYQLQKEFNIVEKLYIDYKKFTSSVRKGYHLAPDKALTVPERRILKVLNSYPYIWKNRVVNLGFSDEAIAWTDGESYITIDRNWLKKLSLNYNQHVSKLIMVMSHELAHDVDTRGTHGHGPHFYEHQIKILESTHSPLHILNEFYHKMQRSKIEEKKEKADKKRNKIQEKINKKLGIHVDTSVI